jgi:hypothetical protein
MTTREKVERLLDRLSEAELAAEYERLREAVESGRTVDQWGDLDAWGDAVGKGAFDELDKQEAAIGFSWETHRRA